jgi:uncharacterized repeat protein (TIGR03803 family)
MRFHGFATSIVCILICATGSSVAFGQELIPFSFNGTNGADPYCTLARDSAGNLYGTTYDGGAVGAPYGLDGTVFELSPGTGGTWTETVLYNFGSVAGDGIIPLGGVVLDSKGNLYGTTTQGGANGQGTVYEISPGTGGTWTEKILYSFGATGTDAENPRRGSLLFDEAGNLYGTTVDGGANGVGTVFELSPGTGGTWTEKILYSFGATSTDAAGPSAGLVWDAAGNLYGTTGSGGANSGAGTVYELSPGTGGTWTEKVLHSFADNGVDGTTPLDTPVFDPLGNLYGTAYNYGPSGSLGIVWELTPSADGAWSEQVLHGFTGTLQGDGDYPFGGLVLDANGNLYGATSSGGFAGEGIVFELSPAAGGWKETILYGFATILSGNIWDSHVPEATLILAPDGNLYGTASSGGNNSFGQDGTVFEIENVTTASPQFSPPPGAYSTAQSVTLSDATANATIYYSIDGGTSFTPYTAPVDVSESEILLAYATSTTLPQSQMAAAGYQIGSVAATPVFMPAPGDYTVAQSVAIADAAPGATIRYTTNGNTPSNISPVYAGPISVTATTTIKAMATATGLTNSAVATGAYTITPVTPPTEEVLYSFAATSTDGAIPFAGLISDSAGNLYGTTTNGGTNLILYGDNFQYAGTVFELSPATGGGWKEKVLYNFGASGDAALPNASLVMDSKGNLYGTSIAGGTIGQGTVFELSPGTGGTWTESILHSFGTTTTDGEVPASGLIFDSAGNLYGTTEQGGANTAWAAGSGGWGTVFELSPGTGGTWTEQVIYAFGYLSQTDGYFPVAGVIFDSKGNLYGTTSDGGSGQDLEGGGTVFELSPATGGSWTETVLYGFGGGSPNGYKPEGGLAIDAEGNLYGTTSSGGNGYGLDGTAFELSPAGGGAWTFAVIHSFGAYETDGFNPTSGMIFDADGNLYGTTFNGGTDLGGTVFELSPATGGVFDEQVLYNFAGPTADGIHPEAGLIFNSSGNLFGTTRYGGANGSGSSGGTVFELETKAKVNAPTATLTPGSFTFASTTVGATSAAQVVTLKNTSASLSLTINTITFTGADPGSFTQTATTCGASLAAGASCTISVAFKPTHAGALTANLSVADNATNSPQTSSLAGTGVAATAPTATLTPTSLSFGSETVGSTTASQVVTLKNTSASVALTINTNGISFTGADPGSFTRTATTCGTTLAAGASCTISVAFKPTHAGALTANLSVADNATGSPQTSSLTGTGVAAAVPTATLSPTSLSFGSETLGSTTAAQVVTLKNTSASVALTINTNGITFTGADPGSFTQTATTCGTTLAAGASCTISVAFRPTHAGALTAYLSIADNATGSPQTSSLAGTGVAAPTATLSPTSLAFGSETVGSTTAAQVVTLKNTSASLTLTINTNGITFTGADPGSFTQTATTCGTTLAAGASCTISVAFKPTHAGALTANLSVADNGASSPQTVALSGTGT